MTLRRPCVNPFDDGFLKFLWDRAGSQGRERQEMHRRPKEGPRAGCTPLSRAQAAFRSSLCLRLHPADSAPSSARIPAAAERFGKSVLDLDELEGTDGCLGHEIAAVCLSHFACQCARFQAPVAAVGFTAKHGPQEVLLRRDRSISSCGSRRCLSRGSERGRFRPGSIGVPVTPTASRRHPRNPRSTP
jgi:hypothetical protein